MLILLCVSFLIYFIVFILPGTFLVLALSWTFQLCNFSEIESHYLDLSNDCNATGFNNCVACDTGSFANKGEVLVEVEK